MKQQLIVYRSILELIDLQLSSKYYARPRCAPDKPHRRSVDGPLHAFDLWSDAVIEDLQLFRPLFRLRIVTRQLLLMPTVPS